MSKYTDQELKDFTMAAMQSYITNGIYDNMVASKSLNIAKEVLNKLYEDLEQTRYEEAGIRMEQLELKEAERREKVYKEWIIKTKHQLETTNKEVIFGANEDQLSKIRADIGMPVIIRKVGPNYGMIKDSH